MTNLTNKLAAFGVMTLAIGGIATAAAPASAHPVLYYPSIYSGTMPGSYQGPRGNYYNFAAVVRSVNGTPCGIICTRDAQYHWRFMPR